VNLTDGIDLARRFGGVARVYGDAAVARFAQARIVVVGLGGVGSWAAEALARSAIGHLTLVDLDHVAESNVNRQIHAVEANFGKAKVVAMAERIGSINPVCAVRAVDAFAEADNASDLIHAADVLIDCTDQVRAKAALIVAARAARVIAITCGAAGGRMDPTRIRVDDLARACGDPLLAKLRGRLRREHGFARPTRRRTPRFGVTAVFSDETLVRPAAVCNEGGRIDPGAPLACAGYGSSVAVTAAMGFVAAGQALTILARMTRPAD
jgi:tRNA A37 threonylcarbamoyladenosine dehydratase